MKKIKVRCFLYEVPLLIFVLYLYKAFSFLCTLHFVYNIDIWWKLVSQTWRIGDQHEYMILQQMGQKLTLGLFKHLVPYDKIDQVIV